MSYAKIFILDTSKILYVGKEFPCQITLPNDKFIDLSEVKISRI